MESAPIRTTLSLAQQGFHGAMTEFDPTWQHVVEAVWTPALDVERLRACLPELGRRHPLLGARLVDAQLEWRDDAPATVEELAGTDGDETMAALAARADEQFDLAGEPPLRLVVAKSIRGGSVVAAVAHHLVLDDLGLQVVLDDLWRLYGGAELADAPPSFLDHVLAEQEKVASGALERNVEYWTIGFSGAEPELSWPGRPEDPDTMAMTAEWRTLDAEELAALKRDAARLRLTVFPVLLAALCEGLRAVTPEREALLQLITHGRPPRFARTGGHFAESLIVRIPLGDGVLDADRLAEVNALVAIAQERAVPSRTLYDRVECFAERKARTYVHCDVMVNYVVRHRPLDEQWSAASGLALETTELVGRRSRTAAPYGGLVLYARMAADSERLTLRLEYEQGLLPQETAAAMGDKFLTALRSLSNKEGRLSAPLLPQPIPES